MHLFFRIDKEKKLFLKTKLHKTIKDYSESQ